MNACIVAIFKTLVVLSLFFSASNRSEGVPSKEGCVPINQEISYVLSSYDRSL